MQETEYLRQQAREYEAAARAAKSREDAKGLQTLAKHYAAEAKKLETKGHRSRH